MKALSNACVLTDRGFQEHHTVIVSDALIHAVMDDGDFDQNDIEAQDIGGQLLLPGFVDIQVNGGGGVLFNDSPSVDSIRAIAVAHRRYGTTGFLPTLISDDLDSIAAAIAAADAAIAAGVPGVLGIHLEGPFLNKQKRGVHDASKLRVLDMNAIELLSSLTSGKTMVTLAPEMTSPELIRALVDAGVIVAAGHSNASYEEVQTALDAGLSGFTHLFNAMSQLSNRAPGVVGAALDDEQSWCGLIADGHHVHPAALRIAIASKTRGRCLLITDAMPCVGADQKTFELNGQAINISDGKCVTADGTLAGSSLDMASAVRYTEDVLGVDRAEAVRMASQYPAEAIGLGDQIGRIAPGYRANFVIADHDLNIVDTWIDGQH